MDVDPEGDVELVEVDPPLEEEAMEVDPSPEDILMEVGPPLLGQPTHHAIMKRS